MKRSSCKTLALGTVAALGLLAGTCSFAQAQTIFRDPNGAVGIPQANGTITWYHPSAFNPGANTLMPGTSVMVTPNGPMWMGADGQLHGTTVSPNGDLNIYSGRSKQFATLPHVGSTRPSNVYPPVRPGRITYPHQNRTSFRPDFSQPTNRRVFGQPALRSFRR